ncbi:MAG: hypothetical protein U0Y68_23965 [Blastocatellia bacterium]
MITEERRAYLREIGRRGGQTRAKQLTPAHQRAARRKVKRESLVRAGQKGAQVTADRHGHEKLFEASRQKRLRNPSKWELLAIGILARLGVEYEREGGNRTLPTRRPRQ